MEVFYATTDAQRSILRTRPSLQRYLSTPCLNRLKSQNGPSLCLGGDVASQSFATVEAWIWSA